MEHVQLDCETIYKIAVIPGDGIGPEIIDSARAVLKEVSAHYNFKVKEYVCLAGGAAIDVYGEPLPAETLAACKNADAVLLGAVGGPKWDRVPTEKRPEKALLDLRKELGLYANLRPAKLYPALAAASPLHPEIVKHGIDILFVRELIGGIYFGNRGRSGQGQLMAGFDTERYSVAEVKRIARMAFMAAEGRDKRVTSVDKANVLESSRVWRETVEEVAADHPAVSLEHLYVDNAAMQLVKRPGTFDVIVTTNMFGDILSDEAAMITGSIGILPSASLGAHGEPGMYEPIHGSAPDIAGSGKANPLATILSVAMMLRHSLQQSEAAADIERAVEKVLEEGWRSPDLILPNQTIDQSKILNCEGMTEQVLANL
ncbi:MAG TPA: 3-isopropylmalate dehydrogenase [Clostridiaceae bacterium]|nr:3-isopropylmalate dehydrogenase [Clostridiaceae bacterium]